MTLSKCALALALIAAVGLAGCGNLTKSPAEGLTFKPPGGWRASPGMLGMMQVWVSPKTAAGTQELLLLKMPVVVRPLEAIDQAQLKDAKLQERRDVTICGGEKATFARFSATSERDNQRIQAETVIAPANGKTIIAMYIRPFGEKADAAVTSSIYQLCPVKS